MLSSTSTPLYTAPDRHIIPLGFVSGLIRMSTGDDKSTGSSPNKSPRRSRPASRPPSRPSSRASSARPRQGPANIIEFVDSQDPNVKSAIQRHTAYHSAAQRREARMQSLRRGTQSSYLDWGRRQETEPTSGISPVSSSSSPHQTIAFEYTDFPPGSLSTTPAPILPTSDPPTLSRQSSGESTTTTTTLTSSEEALLQFLKFYIRAQHNLVPSNRESITHLQDLPTTTLSPNHPVLSFLDATVSFIRLDEACTQLLLAYAHALRSRLQENPASTETDNQSARTYLARGTSLLRNSLHDSATASSDANIQAVLLLVSYTADFGIVRETDIHADALRTMVQQREGLEFWSGRPVVHRQLIAANTARRYHLTLSCQSDCCRDVRFPGGFWTAGA